jgi:L-lysine exporter family protein LysE/ArgO
MIAAAVAGFLLGGSLIVAIGAQNAFVLRQGLRRRHVFAVAAICAASDAALIAAGVGGLGSLIAAQPSLLVAARVGGALFLFAYGCRSFLRAARPGQLLAGGGGGDDSLAAAVAACLAFTFLNPHVYLDTVVLLGGISAAYAGLDRVAFAGGAATASVVWFFGLGYGATFAAPIFARPAAWRILDVAIGIVMWTIAASLVREFFR